MGQNSSRTHRHSTHAGLSSNSITGADNEIAGTTLPSSLASEPTSVNVAPQAGPSRRSSVRKSILNLVKPSGRKRTDSTVSSSRKSWRHSKRWSKAPELTETPESSQSCGSSSVQPSPVNEKGKGVDRTPDPLSIEPPIDANESSSILLPLPSPQDVSQLSEGPMKVDNEAGQNESEERDDAVTRPDPVDPPPDDATNLPQQAEAPPQIALEPPAENQSAPPAPTHQFPPPGTLVVVQGVVHTTDVPRLPALTHSPLGPVAPAPSPSSTPPNPPSGSARNRLSALLQSRPASMIGSRPPSTVGTISSNNHTPVTLDATPSSDNPSPNPSIPVNIPVNPNSETEPAIPSPPNPPTQMTPSNDSRPGTISSSSIDVLGTLLSVAAAATAASLLAGTEPLLASNHGPTATPTTHPNAPNADPWISRPTSPTPTAGLGSGITATDPAAAGRAERLRQAWGNIRERLGLRPAPNPDAMSSIDSNSPESDGPVTSPSNDPRELVLAQMARAFNLGFGLAGDNNAQNGADSEELESRNGGEAGSSAIGATGFPPQPPLEGSFERFLADLQVDLRVALTSSNSTDSTPTAQAPSPAGPTANASPRDRSSRRGYAAPGDDENDQDQDDDLHNSGDISDSESEFDAHEPGDDEAATSEHRVDSSPSRGPDQHQSSSPPLSTLEATELPNVLPTSIINRASPTESSGPDIDPTRDNDTPGRINWWRLYRFPPITTPRPPGAAATMSPSSTTISSSSNTAPGSLGPLPQVDPTLIELPFANDMEEQRPLSPPQEHTVVPVIVVGVQSMNASWQPPTGTDGPDDADNAPDAEISGEPEANAEQGVSDANDTDTVRQSAPRGRAWHSRAAEAIRNLRPGRRERTTPAADSPGSRTFLIYVIGGYYPPDHNIVTGGPNSLDSFEALLELAELLGQVKPPTVTKEDIEQSGLEIIKSSQLKQYENAQKISSNCTERCLICLDDYAPEDDIRVMTCRHAFHKMCVDKWLETGRNNCPACRSKGVSLDARASPAV